MSAPTSTTIARTASSVVASARNAARSNAPVKKKRTPKPEHGQQIFVYHHLQKNNVVYSLSKALKNNAALRQLPYNGKKTVPAALRKDLWHPFATISFPSGSGSIGLSAFQKLREYRRRHELEWDESMFTDSEGNFVAKKKRGRLLCDQKANSVADMAAVLSRLSLAPSAAGGEGGEGEEARKGKIGLVGEGTGAQVEVKWRDLNDAEFAATWSDNVEHGVLEMHTNNRDGDNIWGVRKMMVEETKRRQGKKAWWQKKLQEMDATNYREWEESEAKRLANGEAPTLPPDTVAAEPPPAKLTL